MIRLILAPKKLNRTLSPGPESAKLSTYHHLTPSTANALSVLEALNLEGNLKSLLIFFSFQQVSPLLFYNHREILKEVHCQAIIRLLGG